MYKPKRYFASANTSRGFISFFDYLIDNSEMTYILKGGPGTGKSNFMKKVGKQLLEYGYSVDFIHCSADTESLDAIYIINKKISIVDGTKPHVIDPKYPYVNGVILNIGQFLDSRVLRKSKNEIKECFNYIENEYKEFYNILKEAKVIYENLEREYLKGMDFERADRAAIEVMQALTFDKLDKLPNITRRFSSAMTPTGQVNFYQSLTDNKTKRYIVKGRPGTGKSTLMKKIGKKAEESGYDVEYYHCAFDPESLDMVIIPELDFAILDGTYPHIIEASDGDVVVDMFLCIDKSIVKEDEGVIVSLNESYKNEMIKARSKLFNIKKMHKRLEDYYINATDFEGINTLRDKITDEIIRFK